MLWGNPPSESRMTVAATGGWAGVWFEFRSSHHVLTVSVRGTIDGTTDPGDPPGETTGRSLLPESGFHNVVSETNPVLASNCMLLDHPCIIEKADQ